MAGKRNWVDEPAERILGLGKKAIQTAGQARVAESQAWVDLGGKFPANRTPRRPYQANVPAAPTGYSVDAHMAEAGRRRGDPEAMLWWMKKVWPKHDWDPKRVNLKYEDLGNFDFGATGTALGIPPDILLRGAGAAQMVSDMLDNSKRWHPEWGWPLGPRPYGDEPRDQPVIMNGVDYARRRQNDRRR